MLFTLGNKVQNGLKMEKPCAFDLARRADAYASEMSLARAFVKFGTAESRVKFHTVLGAANPDGPAVGLI